MNLSIAFLSDLGVRWPPSKWYDPTIDRIQETLAAISFRDFENLSMYFHLLSVVPSDGVFGMEPGVVRMRLSRKDNEMVVTWACAGAEYMRCKSWEEKSNYVVEGVRETLAALYARYKMDECELAYYDYELEQLRNKPA